MQAFDTAVVHPTNETTLYTFTSSLHGIIKPTIAVTVWTTKFDIMSGTPIRQATAIGRSADLTGFKLIINPRSFVHFVRFTLN